MIYKPRICIKAKIKQVALHELYVHHRPENNDLLGFIWLSTLRQFKPDVQHLVQNLPVDIYGTSKGRRTTHVINKQSKISTVTPLVDVMQKLVWLKREYLKISHEKKMTSHRQT